MDEAEAVVLTQPQDLVLKVRIQDVNFDADDLVAHRRHNVIYGGHGPTLGDESARDTG